MLNVYMNFNKRDSKAQYLAQTVYYCILFRYSHRWFYAEASCHVPWYG